MKIKLTRGEWWILAGFAVTVLAAYAFTPANVPTRADNWTGWFATQVTKPRFMPTWCFVAVPIALLWIGHRWSAWRASPKTKPTTLPPHLADAVAQIEHPMTWSVPAKPTPLTVEISDIEQKIIGYFFKTDNKAAYKNEIARALGAKEIVVEHALNSLVEKDLVNNYLNSIYPTAYDLTNYGVERAIQGN